MTRIEVLQFFESIHADVDSTLTIEEQKALMKNYQRTRTLAIWHDHATVLSRGYILITINVIYDDAVFVTQSEIQDTNFTSSMLQHYIEEPEIHMIAVCSSSVADQATLVPDRINCIQSIHEPVFSSKGVPIIDRLRFFIGDHPAQSFERGTKQGGTYKCGRCGCPASRMDDAAYALQLPWRSLEDLHALVTTSPLGRQPNALRPFENLKVEELRRELRIRNEFDLSGVKKELQQRLYAILKGAQRVPSLLLSTPTQSLCSLNLDEYTILDCEPLHDLKGHLLNLFEELPYVLPPQLQLQCKELLEANLAKEKVTGADIRATSIHILLLLLNSDVNEKIILLQLTIVKVSEILYSISATRSQKSILKLYNFMWLHHALCQELFSQPKTMSRTKFFGLYLHTLSSHAGPQYEIMCLRSVNTEHQERLFGQARQIVSSTTNRKPNNIIPAILLRLQARRELGQLVSPVQNTESQVQIASKGLAPFHRTKLEVEFVQKHLRSWQAHLTRISNYMLLGEGVWWKVEGSHYIFFDGDSDPNFKKEMTELPHFRSTGLKDLHA